MLGMRKIKIAQIGIGQWGLNILRAFVDLEEVDVIIVADISSKNLIKAKKLGIHYTSDINDFFSRLQDVDAVIISTPVNTHFELTKRALNSNKHVFVEKPITTLKAEAEELVAIAKVRKLHLMVGHIFLYNNSINYVKKIIDSGELGNICFIHGQRTNLGPVRTDVDALWDLASHDISIFNYWLNSEPEYVTAHGSNLLPGEKDDVVHATFIYPGSISCQILASWLHPKKVRQITIVGDRGMLVWDDMNLMEPVKIYHKIVHANEDQEQKEGTLSEFNYTIKNGPASIPFIQLSQPLKNECLAFIKAIRDGERLLSDGELGLSVVRALIAADNSRNSSCSLTKV